MMTTPDLRSLAQQRDIKAITTLLNHYLESHKVTARVALKEEKRSLLGIRLESATGIPQKSLLPVIQNFVNDLGIADINTVKVYAISQGDKNRGWKKAFKIGDPVVSETVTEVQAVSPASDGKSHSQKGYPDFSSYGYEFIEELGSNRQAGRVAYKAIDTNSKELVVVKQFKFTTDASWDDFKEIKREIQILQELEHPGIPKYKSKFESSDGLCLVQEYKAAKNLAIQRSFKSEDIKEIAVKILEILVYLQEDRIPFIIHRDIKPENILVDDDLNVYLVDFGLAHIGSSTLAFSTMFGGTMGFMPPEQQQGKKLTKASDLYGLGATLICLFTQTKSVDFSFNFVDHANRIKFQDSVTDLSIPFIRWLERIVEPDITKRFQSAKQALEALHPLYIKRVPEVRLEQAKLALKAEKLGEKLTPVISFRNPIPDTVLEGELRVARHDSDPIPKDGDSHSWINIKGGRFQGNQIHCKLTVDTGKLRAGETYQRTLLLVSNAEKKVHEIPITICTAPPPVKNCKMPYRWLSYLLAVSCLIPVEIVLVVVVYQQVTVGIQSTFEQLKPDDFRVISW